MENCEYMGGCTFIKQYCNGPKFRILVDMNIRMYCTGDRQENCKRKRLTRNLGNPNRVPPNMTPTGSPIDGIGTDSWPNDVKKALKELMVTA